MTFSACRAVAVAVSESTVVGQLGVIDQNPPEGTQLTLPVEGARPQEGTPWVYPVAVGRW